jgi:hypothetical protein
MTEHMQIAIYKIDDEHSLEEIFKECAEKNFNEQKINSEQVDGFDLKLFYGKKISTPIWKQFFSSVLDNSENFFLQNQSIKEGFLLLLSNSTNIYAIAGGHSHFIIKPFIDTCFGMNILSRVIGKK